MTRWDDLFADLEAQAAALEVTARAGEIDERTRIELAAIGLLDRLLPAVGATVRLRVAGAGPVNGTLRRVGVDWLLVDEAGREALVPLAAIRSVSGLGRHSSVPGSTGAVFARLTLRSALRGLARDRAGVRVQLIDPSGSGEADVLDATIDRVGADFVEVARHPAGEPRRAREVRDVVLVPFAAIGVVRRVT